MKSRTPQPPPRDKARLDLAVGATLLVLTFTLPRRSRAVVEEMADRILVMNQGKIVERLPGTNIRKAAKEPYTRKLIDSVFEPKSAIANRQNRQTDI